MCSRLSPFLPLQGRGALANPLSCQSFPKFYTKFHLLHLGPAPCPASPLPRPSLSWHTYCFHLWLTTHSSPFCPLASTWSANPAETARPPLPVSPGLWPSSLGTIADPQGHPSLSKPHYFSSCAYVLASWIRGWEVWWVMVVVQRVFCPQPYFFFTLSCAPILLVAIPSHH